jgi:hypothetical protein
MTKPTNNSQRLHAEIVAAIEQIRHALGAADAGWFSLDIRSEGRTQTERSEVKIEYIIALGYDDRTKGNSLDATLAEMVRRHGWNRANAPLSLPCGDVDC